ncbi:MAG: SUMF1/EgtB/PvdO family nonheme iron enzyme [Candidatus Hydrogenedentales bacterium]
MIIDHCSISWATDEVLSSFGTRNMTVQWSIMAEGLSRSVHPKGEHSKGSILDGDGGITMHHCLYAHNASRNPRVNTVVLDFRNNVIYDWGYRAGYTRSDPCYVNYVGNYLKPGPNTTKSARTKLFAPGDDMARLFLKANTLEGHPKQTGDNSLLLAFSKSVDADALRALSRVSEPFRTPTVETDSPEQALERVLEHAGAVLPQRDSADSRLMNEVQSGTGRIIDSQNEVGGWPELANGEAPQDSDSDGMPDAWETRHGLNANDGSDTLRDEDGDGYPNLEEFLNDTNPREAERDARVDAATFRVWQDDAVALCAQGRKAVEERKLAQEIARKARREELIRTTKVSMSPSSDGDASTLVLDVGGKATLELVRIPAGSFMMGSPESEGGGEEERPQHKVTISRAFYMAATPTTGAQYVAVMGDETRAITSENQDIPASETTWYEAREFCELLSAMTGRTFRLPTEAEWEYACRAGTTTAFYTGETISTDQANFDGEKATRYNPAGVYRGEITAVKAFPPNPWGLYDMPGNQTEYCLDVFDPKFYTAEEVTDPVNDGADGARAMRGGKHGSKAFFLRSACRMSYAPGVGYGFRVVMEAGQHK